MVSHASTVVVVVMAIAGEESMAVHILDDCLDILTLGVAKATDDSLSDVHIVVLLYYFWYGKGRYNVLDRL
jgi:hypothetical protein